MRFYTFIVFIELTGWMADSVNIGMYLGEIIDAYPESANTLAYS